MKVDIDDLTVESPAPNGDTAYMIPRPAPHGHVLLGGTYQEDNWDTSIDFNVAKRIWKRATELVPDLNTEKTKIISHNVGLRPARKGGPRIELEWLKLPVVSEFLHGHAKPGQVERRFPIIHAYGFG